MTWKAYLKNGIAFSPSGVDTSDNDSSSYEHKLLLDVSSAIIKMMILKRENDFFLTNDVLVTTGSTSGFLFRCRIS